MSDTIETRVARGVALLDEKLPGWVDRIDLEKLDLSSACDCILGQEFDGKAIWPDLLGYDIGLSELFANVEKDAARHGFTAGAWAAAEAWDELEGEWRRVILARRGGAS